MIASAFETLSPAGYQWFYFGALVSALILGSLAVLLWMKLVPKKRKRKRRHHGHGHLNPTRAETGGLPLPKEPGEDQDEEKPASHP